MVPLCSHSLTPQNLPLASSRSLHQAGCRCVLSTASTCIACMLCRQAMKTLRRCHVVSNKSHTPMPTETPEEVAPASAAALPELRTIVLLSRENLGLCRIAVAVSGAGGIYTDSNLLAWHACLPKPNIALAACMTYVFVCRCPSA